jgi:hypothetical protein
MNTIDEERLESDSQYLYEYLADFIEFGPTDVKAIQASAMHLGPRIPQLVEQTYRQLLSTDATARHFVPRQHGFDGPTPVDLSALTADHPQVRFRKDHLNRYFMQLIGRSYDTKMVQYLDMVGKIHTSLAGSSEIDVPLVQMNALMGAISDVLLASILEWPLESPNKEQTIRAFNKLLWIQNAFVNRHYCVRPA